MTGKTLTGCQHVSRRTVSLADNDLLPSRAVKVDETVAQPPQLTVTAQRDAGTEPSLLDRQDDMVMLVMLRNSHDLPGLLENI